MMEKKKRIFNIKMEVKGFRFEPESEPIGG